MTLLLSATDATYSPMAGPAIREVRAPSNPFFARAPLATGCLLANDSCQLHPCCAYALARGTHLPLPVLLHAHTQAMHLFMRSHKNRRRDPALAALRYTLQLTIATVGIFMISRSRTASWSTGSPRREPVHPSQLGRDGQSSGAPLPRARPSRFRARDLGLAHPPFAAS